RAPGSRAAVGIPSVAMRTRRVSRRWKNRQCRSVHSIIGAIQNLRSNAFILFAFFARPGWNGCATRFRRFLHQLVLLRSSWRKWKAACLRLRSHARARRAPTTVRERRSSLHAVRSWKVATSRTGEIAIRAFLRLAAVAPSHANRLHSHDAEDRKGRQAADVVPLH